RNGMMKLHEPRASMVMKMTIAMRARTSSTVRLRAGEKRPQRRRTGVLPPLRRLSSIVSADTCGPPQEQDQEQCTTDETDHRADGDLVRVTERAAKDVADQYEAGTEYGQVRYRAPDVVAN